MPTTTAPETVIDRIENASPLDPVVKSVRKIVNAALGPQVDALLAPRLPGANPPTVVARRERAAGHAR